MNNEPDAQGFVFDDDGNCEGRVPDFTGRERFRPDCLMMGCHSTGLCQRPGEECYTIPPQMHRRMLAQGDATLHRETGVEVDRAPEWEYEHAVEPGLYRHHKGGFYDVLHIGTCTETGAALVIYRAASNGRIWVRDAAMFEEVLETGRHRFERVVA